MQVDKADRLQSVVSSNARRDARICRWLCVTGSNTAPSTSRGGTPYCDEEKHALVTHLRATSWHLVSSHWSASSRSYGGTMSTRPLRIGVGLSLAVVAVAVPLPDEASASCAAPYLARPAGALATVTPNSRITVLGRAFVRGCADTGGTSSAPGCSGSRQPVERPMRDIPLRFRQRGQEWLVGSADAGTAERNQLGHVTWVVKVPEALQPGKAFIVARGAQPLQVTVGDG